MEFELRPQKKRVRTSVRCFVALDLPVNIVEEAEQIQSDFKLHDTIIGNYTKPENIHLTLKFLGEIPEDTLEKVKEELKTIQMSAFECSIDEVGVFSPEFVRILWLHCKGDEVLALQSAVDEKLGSLFSKENRFQSHITIARVHNVRNKETLLEHIKTFKVKETRGKAVSFSLMKSTLTDKGSVFEVIERYSLS